MVGILCERLAYTRTIPTAAHHRARVVGTLGAATAHGTLAYLGTQDLLNYTVPTRYSLIDQVASEHAWAWIHLTAAVLMLLSLRWGEWKRNENALPLPAIACSIGFALMFTWGFFNLLWGLSAIRPVSLAGPVLALIVAAGEHLLASAWNRGSHAKGR
jgi:hypothetical protein